MRKIAFALGWFALGALCMSLFGNLPSPFPRTTVLAEERLGNIYTPVVMPPGMMMAHNNFEGPIELDGLILDGNTLRDPTFIYGGGAYLMRNTTIVPGKIGYQLIGAAGNTMTFLNSLGLGVCPLAQRPTAPPPVNPNAPIIETAKLSEPVKGTFSVPYNGSKK